MKLRMFKASMLAVSVSSVFVCNGVLAQQEEGAT